MVDFHRYVSAEKKKKKKQRTSWMEISDENLG